MWGRGMWFWNTAAWTRSTTSLFDCNTAQVMYTYTRNHDDISKPISRRGGYTNQSLLQMEGKQHRIANLSKRLENHSSQVGKLQHIIHIAVIVAQDALWPVLEPRQLDSLWQHFGKDLDVGSDIALRFLVALDLLQHTMDVTLAIVIDSRTEQSGRQTSDWMILSSSSMTTAIPWYPRSLTMALKCGAPTKLLYRE